MTKILEVMTKILENVKVFAQRRGRKGYDNTPTFSSKTAELIKGIYRVLLNTCTQQNFMLHQS